MKQIITSPTAEKETKTADTQKSKQSNCNQFTRDYQVIPEIEVKNSP